MTQLSQVILAPIEEKYNNLNFVDRVPLRDGRALGGGRPKLGILLLVLGLGAGLVLPEVDKLSGEEHLQCGVVEGGVWIYVTSSQSWALACLSAQLSYFLGAQVGALYSDLG